MRKSQQEKNEKKTMCMHLGKKTKCTIIDWRIN